MGDDDRPVVVRTPARIDFAGGWSDVHHFSEREGGAALNAGINPCVEGRASWQGRRLHVEYSLELPPGSHLGTSASVDVAWLALTNGLMDKSPSPVELAETAYRLEKLLGVEGGKQDQYAAALGGFNALRFGREDEPARVERLDVPVLTIHALQERLLLCDAGLPPRVGSVHEKVWQRYRGGDENVAAALREIRDSVTPARDALLAGDLEGLARQLAVNREATRRLHPDVITSQMDELFAAGEAAGALGSKACGAGGGGCLLFLCDEGRREAIEAALRDAGGVIIGFTFAHGTTTIG